MLSDSVHRRRMAYRRSHTLSTLPTNLVQEVEQESEDDSTTERSKLITSKNSPIHSSGSTSDLDRLILSNDQENINIHDKLTNAKRKQSSSKKNMSRGGKAVVSGASGRGGTGTKSGNGISRSLSGPSAENLNATSQSNSTTSSRAKRFGRTPSTPSIILNKVKDRIREKMFQTSADWSHGAAIIQERRQRSVDAFQARRTKSRKSLEKDDIEIEQVPLKELNKKKRARMKSDPIPAVVLTNADEFTPAEAARLAFRRRSISEDTYDRRPCLPKVKLGSPDNTAGIICSNEDLQAIAGQSDNPKGVHKKSPQTSKRSSLEPQGSIESSSSTYSSRSARAFSLEGESPSDRPADLLALRGTEGEESSTVINPSGGLGAYGLTSPQYPEVILEKKHKDNRSSSVHSNISGPMVQHLSGSKNSVSDRRASEHKEEESRRLLKDQSETVDDDDDDKPKPVPEVVFDEFGQTWDVYGAEVDPEMVGDAIQRHLVKLMQRKQEEPGPAQTQKIEDEEQKAGKGRESMGFLLRFLCLFNNRRQTPSS